VFQARWQQQESFSLLQQQQKWTEAQFKPLVVSDLCSSAQTSHYIHVIAVLLQIVCRVGDIAHHASVRMVCSDEDG
jgi:hypothetical protein